MFANSKTISIIVNSNKKNILLKWIKLCFNTKSIQFILGVPMGGNASLYIADVYLSWCEYGYKSTIVKIDYAMAKLLLCNCRYFDDICTEHLKYLGGITKDI